MLQIVTKAIGLGGIIWREKSNEISNLKQRKSLHGRNVNRINAYNTADTLKGGCRVGHREADGQTIQTCISEIQNEDTNWIQQAQGRVQCRVL